MKKLLPVLLSFLLFVCCDPTNAKADGMWVGAAAKVAQSTVYIAFNVEEMVDGASFRYTGSCTGYVIDNNRDFVFTAAHCLSSDNTYVVDTSLVGKAVWMHTPMDLMVLKVDGINKPSLRPRSKPIRVGMDAAAFGWGYSLNEPLFRAGHVSALSHILDGAYGNWLALDTTFIGGMSGGPIFDVEGKLMGSIQLSDRTSTGWGRTIADVLDSTRGYWQYSE